MDGSLGGVRYRAPCGHLCVTLSIQQWLLHGLTVQLWDIINSIFTNIQTVQIANPTSVSNNLLSALQKVADVTAKAVS